MNQPPGHRKRVRHYHDPGHIHELTFSCFHRQPLLTNDAWREMLAESIDRAMEGHRYRLFAFVFMPEHVHLMVYPLADADTIDAVLKAIKRPFSYRIKQLLYPIGRPTIGAADDSSTSGRDDVSVLAGRTGLDRNLSQMLDRADRHRLFAQQSRPEEDWSKALWTGNGRVPDTICAIHPEQYPRLPIVHNLLGRMVRSTRLGLHAQSLLGQASSGTPFSSRSAGRSPHWPLHPAAC